MPSLIPLSQGQSAIVDDVDYEWLSQWKWSAQKGSHSFYAMRHDQGKLVLMHRVINETPEGSVTDHKDGNGLNNQRSNLRTATQLQNMMNRAPKKGGTSVHKGVWFDGSVGTRNKNQWRSAIRLNGKLKYLGRFATEDEAGAAYQEASRHHFGEFHRSTGDEA